MLGRKVDDLHMRYVVCDARAQGLCEYCGAYFGKAALSPYYFKDEKRFPGPDGMVALCSGCAAAADKIPPPPKKRRKRAPSGALFEDQWLEKQVDRNKL